MKPRTKQQKHLSELVKSFKGLTPAQCEMYKKQCFEKLFIESRTRLVCVSCGHSWKASDAGNLNVTECPHCKARGKVSHHHTSYEDMEYFCVSKQIENYQLFRIFEVHKKASRKELVFGHTEIGCLFMDENGKIIIFSRRLAPNFYYFDKWCYDTEIEYRPSSKAIMRIPIKGIHTESIMPILKRNGWNGELFGARAHSLPFALLTKPWIESWWKMGHVGMVLGYFNGVYFDLSWAERIAKIAHRHGRIFKTVNGWLDFIDYVRDLSELGKDIYNPTIIFPADFQAEHMKCSELVRVKRQKEAEERRRQHAIDQAIREAEKNRWIKDYQSIFKAVYIERDGLFIRPLLTLNDFQSESDAMRHCILSYYGKKDTLLLSISDESNKLETAEVNLTNGTIVQCRGKYNGSTNRHDEIVSAINQSMMMFVTLYKNFLKHSNNQPKN